MRPYDAKRDYYRWYFSEYPHAIALSDHIPHEWMDANLEKTYTATHENCMAQEYTTQIIGYGIGSVPERPDEKLYFFHDQEHYHKVIDAFPELVVTADPFGPALCPNCGGPSPAEVATIVEERRPWYYRWLPEIVLAAGIAGALAFDYFT